MPTLHWLTRDADLKLSGQAPYRLLEPVRSYGDPQSGNMLIQGDNLDALKALLPFYGGKVKCVCVDPPYNTQSAFAQYDDNLEHTRWLSMMYPRLELLRDLLSEDGTIWTCIDDNEGHYLKVIMDEVFGRRNFVASNVWQNRYSRENREAIGDSHNYILLYAKRPDTLKEVRNLLPVGEKQRRLYKNPDDDSRGAWQSVSLLAQGYRPNRCTRSLPRMENTISLLRGTAGKSLSQNTRSYLLRIECTLAKPAAVCLGARNSCPLLKGSCRGRGGLTKNAVTPTKPRRSAMYFSVAT